MMQTASFKKHLSSPSGANVFGVAAPQLKCLASHKKHDYYLIKLRTFFLQIGVKFQKGCVLSHYIQSSIHT